MKNTELKTKKSAGQSGDDGNVELRNKRIFISISPGELEKIDGFYKHSSQTTFAGFCREKLLSKPEVVKNNRQLISEISQVLYELNKIGTNINQIAKRVNSIKGDYPELAEQLQEILEDLKDIRLKVKQ